MKNKIMNALSVLRRSGSPDQRIAQAIGQLEYIYMSLCDKPNMPVDRKQLINAIQPLKSTSYYAQIRQKLGI